MTVEHDNDPPGYLAWRQGDTDVVAVEPLARAIRDALEEGTLYDYAAHHPNAERLSGRGVAYAVPLPGGSAEGVVRRSRHGGLLAPITGEHFFGATRAPRELANALRLRRQGVATPEVLAYATYHAGPMLRRADVVTRRVPNARDLAACLAADDGAERAGPLLDAVATLMARMAEVGARHPDFNIKNVLIARDENGALEAYVLDVDRVWFDRSGPGRAAAANLRRFARSAHKWRRLRGLPIDDGHLLTLRASVEALGGGPTEA